MQASACRSGHSLQTGLLASGMFRCSVQILVEMEIIQQSVRLARNSVLEFCEGCGNCMVRKH